MWLSTVSKLRNKVVHGGYRPTEVEAKAALVSMVEVEDHIERLIGDQPNATQYPFTAYMMLGPVGLTEAGSFTERIRTTIEGKHATGVSRSMTSAKALSTRSGTNDSAHSLNERTILSPRCSFRGVLPKIEQCGAH